MKSIDAGYCAEVDQISKSEWSNLLVQFEDATIYQTWSYGAIRWGEKNLSHLVLRKAKDVVGIAQVSTKSIPFLGAGIAYIPWGPLWRLKGKENDVSEFAELVRALRKEYAMKRGLLLRITPNEIDGNHNQCVSILQNEGYVKKAQPYRTLLIDLTVSMEDLYRGLARRWKRALKTAESKGLKVIQGIDQNLFETLNTLYADMVGRKGFVPGVKINEFRSVQSDLPEILKMKIMVCEHDGKPVSSLMTSLIGNKGIGIIGGTKTNGLSLGGFHLLNWKMMEWMKSEGAKYYDFGGYDPENNPGTASFKEGLPGHVVTHIGQFEASDSFVSSIAVGSGEVMRSIFRKARMKSNEFKRKLSKTGLSGSKRTNGINSEVQ